MLGKVHENQAQTPGIRRAENQVEEKHITGHKDERIQD
jgi:hypothetical protein